MLAHMHELTLGLAFGLGALHALEPGHGKSAMLVYLAGQKRSWLHPLVMGISSAVSHSLSLIAIAALVHLTHHLVTGDHHHENETVTRLMQWISALLVIAVGIWMTWSAWKAKPSQCGCSKHHECEPANELDTPPRTRTTYSMSALLGVAFGLLPCPSAMAAYFTSMSAGTPVAAYLVIGLFAAGIATSLTIVGVAVQSFGAKAFKNGSRLASLPWPYIRAGLITSVGLFYLARVALV